MPTLFDEAARAALIARLDHLTPETARRWGTMTSPQMAAHCAGALRMALGDLVIPPRKTFLSNPVVRYLFVHVLPIPRGAPTARQLKREPDGIDFEAERAALRELLDRAGRCSPAGAWAPHPAFGALTGRDWGVLIWKHMDHHFRQFGI